MSDNTKIYITQLIAEDSLSKHGFHIYPNMKFVGFIHQVELLELLLANFITDRDGVELSEHLLEPPRPEDYENEKDYQTALEFYKRLMNSFTLLSKIKGKFNPTDLFAAMEFIKTFRVVEHAVDSVKGHKLYTLVTEQKEVKAQLQGSKKKFLSVLQSTEY